jgi:hypothetical protein
MFLFLNFIHKIHTITVPYIEGVVLQSTGYSKPNTTIYFNTTCQERLCNYFNESVLLMRHVNILIYFQLLIQLTHLMERNFIFFKRSFQIRVRVVDRIFLMFLLDYRV